MFYVTYKSMHNADLQVNVTCHILHLISSIMTLCFELLACKYVPDEYNETRQGLMPGLSGDMYKKFLLCCVISFQAHLIRSVTTLFPPIPRSNSFLRSSVGSSCPNHQIPCWATAERYRHTKTHITIIHISSITAQNGTHYILYCLLFHQIIDPFVEVEIIGLPVDCCKEQTRVVDDNG